MHRFHPALVIARYHDLRRIIRAHVLSNFDYLFKLCDRKIDHAAQKAEAVPEHVKAVALKKSYAEPSIIQCSFRDMVFIGGATALDGRQIEHHVQVGHEQVEDIVAHQPIIRVVVKPVVGD